MSIEWAEFISFWSNWVLVAALIVGVAATYGIVVSGNVKETAAKSQIARLTKDTAQLSVEAESARAKIADANARALQAEAELAKLKTPRVLPDMARSEMVNVLGSFAGTPFDLGVNPGAEPQNLMMQIASVLDAAKWKWEKNPKAGSIIVEIPGKPPAMIMTSFIGLALEIDGSKKAEWTIPLTSLCLELRKTFPETLCNVANDGSVPTNAIHIYIGTKM